LILEIPLDLNEQSSADEKSLDRVAVEVLTRTSLYHPHCMMRARERLGDLARDPLRGWVCRHAKRHPKSSSVAHNDKTIQKLECDRRQDKEVTQSGSARAFHDRPPQCSRWLVGLPKDYAGISHDVPRLGPPLPCDLGRPIVAAQNQSGPLAADAEQQRVNQESEAARTSKVFASTNVRPLAAKTASNEIPGNAPSLSDEAFTQNGQDRKLAFVNASVDRRTTSPDRSLRRAQMKRQARPKARRGRRLLPRCLTWGKLH
jgi:type IV secretory pathway VirB10-like protein